MKFSTNYKSLWITKIIALILFIPITIIVLFIAVPLLMVIVSIVLVIMYLTRNKFSGEYTSFNAKDHPFVKNINKLVKKMNNQKKEKKKSDYVDAEFITIDENNNIKK